MSRGSAGAVCLFTSLWVVLFGSFCAYAQAQDKAPNVSIQTEKLPFRITLDILFKAGERSYLLDPTLQKAQGKLPPGTITMHIHDAPFDDTLNALLHCEGLPAPLTYKVKHDLYIIFPDKKGKLSSQKGIRYREKRAGADASGDNKITMGMKTQGLDEALYYLFDGMKKRYRIAPDVPPNPGTVQFQVEDATATETLQALLDSVNKTGTPLQYRIENDVYIISLDKSVPITDKNAARGNISLKLENVPLHDALQRLFAMDERNYAFILPADLPDKVTLSIKDASGEMALANILRSLEAAPPYLSAVKDGITLIYPAGPPSPQKKRLTLRVSNASLYVTLRTILSLFKVNFTLENNTEEKVMLRLDNVSIEEALKTVLHKFERTWRVKDGVYEVVPNTGVLDKL